MAKKKKKSNKSISKPMSDKRFITEKAQTLPIYKCYASTDWENTGLAHVIVARERGNNNLCVGIYMCDTWCLGVKDAYGIVNISKEDFKRDVTDRYQKLKECDYTYAHNLVYGAEAFAADAGINSHPNFALWGKILEEDTDDVPLIDMDFGDNGKYHLIAEKGSKEAQYAPGLKKRLGDDFIFDIGSGLGFNPDQIADFEDFDENEDEEEEDDAYSEFRKLLGVDSPESMEELLQGVTDGFRRSQEEDRRHPDEVYSYQHPSYPEKLEIKHEFIAEEFSKPTNNMTMPAEVIDRILALPKDEVVSDISKIIMYTIGKTWKAIDDDTLEWTDDYTIIHSLAFLTEMRDEAGLDAVMEILRQDDAFSEFHLGDWGSMFLPNAIYVTGRNRTDVLLEFLKHPGYDGFAKGYVVQALSFIAMEEPARRQEIIEIFRSYLNFMQENIPSQNGCSGYVAATVVSSLIDIRAIELLPEIKRLHDSDYVNLNVCGPYSDVVEDIKSNREVMERFDFTDIKALYEKL